jgi:hypothetical protein
MPTIYRKYLPYFLLLFLSIPLFFLNIIDVHSWGDDFSQYIREALNIAHGKPFYQSNYIFNRYNPVYAPPQYPAGFPLLLAPVVKIWGISFRAMCYFNSVIAACLLFALFAYFRKHTSWIAAICLSVLISYSGYMINLKREVLADTSCLLFVTLYLAFRTAETFSWKRIALLVFFGTIAILIRSQAVFMLAAEAILGLLSWLKLVYKTRNLSLKQSFVQPPVFIAAGVLVFFLFLDKVVFYTPANTMSFYNNFIQLAFGNNFQDGTEVRLNYLFTTLSGFFHYETYKGYLRSITIFADSMFLVFAVTGFFINCAKRLSFDDVFFAVMCGLIMYYPVRDPRYFLPALPILFFYCYTTFKVILPVIVRMDLRIAAVIMTVLYLGIGLGYLKKTALEIPAGCIPQQNDLAAYKYISTHVNDQDIIVFTKPRLLTLFTDRKCVNVAWYASVERNKQILDSMNVKYMLIVDHLDEDFFRAYLQQAQHPIDSARIADGYTLYTLR